MKSLCVIPARYSSQRLPGKPLVNLGDGAMIEVVYRRIASMNLFDKVVVATDDTRISDFLGGKNIPYIMTAVDHISGTDRCAEVASKMADYEIVVNVQGDEPLIEFDLLEGVLNELKKGRGQEIVTGISPIRDKEALSNPNVVKVVVTEDMKALYFSRSCIPYQRATDADMAFNRHIGIYGFKRDTLIEVSQMNPCSLEETERLEQLRWLFYGKRIHCILGPWLGFGIDTAEDVERYRAR